MPRAEGRSIESYVRDRIVEFARRHDKADLAARIKEILDGLRQWGTDDANHLRDRVVEDVAADRR